MIRNKLINIPYGDFVTEKVPDFQYSIINAWSRTQRNGSLEPHAAEGPVTVPPERSVSHSENKSLDRPLTLRGGCIMSSRTNFDLPAAPSVYGFKV